MSSHNWDSAQEQVDEALEITKHDRNQKAGDAEDNFAFIAEGWNALLRAKGIIAKDGPAVSPADTARMMMIVKLCRDSNAPHWDNRVDLHGYTLCLERVEPTETALKGRLTGGSDAYEACVAKYGYDNPLWCDGPVCREPACVAAWNENEVNDG